MHCSNCGTKILEGASYCQSCGTKVNSQKEQEKRLNLTQNSKNSGLTTKNQDSETIQESNTTLLLIEAKNTASGMIKQGIIWSVAGLVITGLTYMFAEPGGTYYVLWGLMVYGAYKFIQGLYYYMNPHKLVDKAIENLRKEAEKMSPDNKDGNGEKNQTKSKPTLVGWLVITFIVGMFLLFVILGISG